jgi:hypothetical protein
MKKYTIIIALTLGVMFNAFAQKEEYCQMTIQNKSFSRKYQVIVDYGTKAEKLKDANGDALDFESSVDAINSQTILGWKIISVNFVFNQMQGLYVQMVTFKREVKE